MGKVMYCEQCGNVYYPFISKKCDFCKTKMKVLSEEIKYKYHIFVEDWIELPTDGKEMIMRTEQFVMGELKDNPLFSMKMYQAQTEKRKQHYLDRVAREKREEEEYRLKIQNKNLARIQKEQDKQNCIPECPICHSTNINKISLSSRAVKTAAFGVIGAVDDAGKIYRCNNCGSKF